MKITKSVAKTIDVIVDILCDKCGDSTSIGPEEFRVYAGTTIRATFGYGSTRDGNEETFDICDKCYEAFVETFATKPIIRIDIWAPTQ